MDIEDIRPDTVRQAKSDAVQRNQRARGPKPEAVNGAGRIDRVEISERGRALAVVHGAGGTEEGEISPERATELRQRMSDGFYDSPDIMNRVAKALLESGDL